MLSSRPKAVVEDRLVKILTKRCKELRILWNPSVFRKGLRNPKLPAWILDKLENLIVVCEASDWKISNAFSFELDETIEDIETFNPKYRAWMNKARRDRFRDIKLGREGTVESFKAEAKR